MRYFLSHHVGTIRCGAASRSMNHSMPRSRPARHLGWILLVVCIATLSSSFAQLPFPTSRGDNARDGANTSEILLTPSNVNEKVFGRLFSVPVDYVVMAQPLYMPNVNIPGQGTHNVIYVVTQMDSVYAIDADTGAQLWWVNFTDPAQGISTAKMSSGTLPCGATVGFDQEGIPGTPVIDTTTNTMYLVAKTVVNGTVQHNLHALDITTGNDQLGSPVLIAGQTISNKGHVMVFNSKYQKNRPGLLLLNGVIYMGFGSNSCNGRNSGWVLAYDEASLKQLAIFNTSPDRGLTSIWQSGNGLAADEAGNIFVETAEAGLHGYDVPGGGQTYCNSVVKLSPDLEVLDYFTPWSVAFLNQYDLDLSSAGVLILPDQNGPNPHELVAAGKQGFVYVLDRDNMGMYSPNDSEVIQEFALIPGETPGDADVVLYGSPAYWNNTVYFSPNSNTPMAFSLSGGLLGTPLTSANVDGGHSPSISANGNSNGILWVITTSQLFAFDAVSLQLLYGTNQAPNGRDKLPPVGHFVTPTVNNGKVYVGARNSLEAYGLLYVSTLTGGNGQTSTVTTALPAPIHVQVSNPYTGQPAVGVTVTFSDGCKAGSNTCGSFNPASAVTDANGNVSTSYTVPQKSGTYTLTISGSSVANTTATATATAGAAVKIYAARGTKQSGTAGSNLANPIVVQALDAYKNGVPGVTIHFTANKGAVPNPSSGISDASGLVNTTLQLPTTVATITVTAGSADFKNVAYVEYSVAGPAANIAITNGNNQFASAGTQLPQTLTVLVTDQYGNPVPGVAVGFSDSGAGGSFFYTNSVTTDNTGRASQLYTLPATPGTVSVGATAAGVAMPAVFTETAQ